MRSDAQRQQHLPFGHELLPHRDLADALARMRLLVRQAAVEPLGGEQFQQHQQPAEGELTAKT